MSEQIQVVAFDWDAATVLSGIQTVMRLATERMAFLDSPAGRHLSVMERKEYAQAVFNAALAGMEHMRAVLDRLMPEIGAN